MYRKIPFFKDTKKHSVKLKFRRVFFNFYLSAFNTFIP